MTSLRKTTPRPVTPVPAANFTSEAVGATLTACTRRGFTILKAGEIAWRAPVGVTAELPEAKRRTGGVGLAGRIVTAGGLVFIGATDDARFRALDARSGKELWEAWLEYAANAVPITYRGKNGK